MSQKDDNLVDIIKSMDKFGEDDIRYQTLKFSLLYYFRKHGPEFTVDAIIENGNREPERYERRDQTRQLLSKQKTLGK